MTQHTGSLEEKIAILSPQQGFAMMVSVTRNTQSIFKPVFAYLDKDFQVEYGYFDKGIGSKICPVKDHNEIFFGVPLPRCQAEGGGSVPILHDQLFERLPPDSPERTKRSSAVSVKGKRAGGGPVIKK